MAKNTKNTTGKGLLRLPIEMALYLRAKGGAHSTPKGKKGYNRNSVKSALRKEAL